MVVHHFDVVVFVTHQFPKNLPKLKAGSNFSDVIEILKEVMPVIGKLILN
jgi:hypothetical protein